MANIIPEPKVHPATTVGLLSEQQPISLTVTIIKQLEATVGGCILEHVYDVLDHQQYGLLNGQSTTDNRTGNQFQATGIYSDGAFMLLQ